MISLLLVRHGNTFKPDDKVIWAGARTDLPLVEKGRAQASTLGQALATSGFKPDRLLAGPLLRTRQHAEIIANLIGFSGDIEIEDALREIDYGAWEALSTEDIYAIGGKAELTAWNTNAIWPQRPGWTPGEHDIEKSTARLLDDLAKNARGNRLLLTTSNGILRFLARHSVNPPSADQLKVRTGHYCQMVFKSDQWHQISWNQPPDKPLTETP